MNKKEIIKYLKEFVNPERFELFEQKLAQRTRYASVLIENIYQPHNASAIVRTCEALGFQDVYVYERKNIFSPNDEIALGAEKWITIYRFNEKDIYFNELISHLRQKGYRIIATTLHQESKNLYEFDIKNGKCLFLFGTEKTGLTHEAIHSADEFIKIPIYGFTQSFNVSVSVGIILNHIAHQLRNNNINFELTQEEKDDILIHWLVQSIPSGEKILDRFLKNA